jgi:hypothetical protein
MQALSQQKQQLRLA